MLLHLPCLFQRAEANFSWLKRSWHSGKRSFWDSCPRYCSRHCPLSLDKRFPLGQARCYAVLLVGAGSVFYGWTVLLSNLTQ